MVPSPVLLPTSSAVNNIQYNTPLTTNTPGLGGSLHAMAAGVETYPMSPFDPSGRT